MHFSHPRFAPAATCPFLPAASILRDRGAAAAMGRIPMPPRSVQCRRPLDAARGLGRRALCAESRRDRGQRAPQLCPHRPTRAREHVVAGYGLISGTPNTTGTYSFLIRATDANDCTATRALDPPWTAEVLRSTPQRLAEHLVPSARPVRESSLRPAVGSRQILDPPGRVAAGADAVGPPATIASTRRRSADTNSPCARATP